MMNSEKNWQQQNYDCLIAEINWLKQWLRRQLPDTVQRKRAVIDAPIAVLHKAGQSRTTNLAAEPLVAEATVSANKSVEQNESLAAVGQTSFILDNLCALFDLSRFDRQLLLLCVAMELDTEMPALCMELIQQPGPCMALALMYFEGHCSAMAPGAPLRYFQFIELKRDSHSFTRQSLVLSDWALFYLTGAAVMAPSLSACLHPLKLTEPLLSTHIKSAEQLNRSRQHMPDEASAVQLLSASADDQRQVAALLAKKEERQIYEFSLYQLPLREDEQRNFLSLIEREVIARQCLLLIDCERLTSSGEAQVDTYPLCNGLDCLIRDLPGACVLFASQRLALPQTKLHYQHLPVPPADEQLRIWQHCLQESNTDDIQPTLLQLTTQYNLSARQVRSIAHSIRIEGKSEGDSEHLQQQLWQHSREQSRQNLQGLAKVISPAQLGWDDLILPENEKNILCSLVAQVRQRQRVYHQWGFAKQVPYGLGICALFAGGSGTGKTMAARIIASLLNLDLYHVELSSVVDKYIGETEKKLDRIFQAAENSGAILLFDEADALFGKRSKVQDARDRYANMGVSFLLQRMESYSGLSILTTNLRSAMDTAFMRRLRFIVQFPFPSEIERQRIWQCMMPANAPTEQLDYSKLARLILSGGAIRNIVLQAAFMAAEAEQPINMQCIREAVHQEYIKSEKTLDENLVKDW